MELQRLQDQLSAIQSERERVAQQGLDTSTLDATIRDVQQQIAEVQSQQHLEERVEQAKETGYILDTIEINGLPAIDYSHTPENHELLAIAVQRLFLSQEQAFNNQLQAERLLVENMNTVNKTLIEDFNKAREDKESLERVNFTLEQEKQDAYQKLANAMDIIAEKDAEIKRLADQQNNAQAIPVIPLSKEEQEKKLMAEVMGKQIKVINVRPKSDSFDNKLFIAVNVITGVEFEDYYIYLCKKDEDKPKRYKEMGLEEATQLQAEYSAKKAEIDAQNAVIPTIEQDIETVTEQEAPAEETPFQESEVQATDNTNLQTDQGNEPIHTVVERTAEESEVVTRAEFDMLSAKVEHIYRFANIPAVA